MEHRDNIYCYWYFCLNVMFGNVWQCIGPFILRTLYTINWWKGCGWASKTLKIFWKKLLTDGVVWCRIYPRWTNKKRNHSIKFLNKFVGSKTKSLKLIGKIGWKMLETFSETKINFVKSLINCKVVTYLFSWVKAFFLCKSCWLSGGVMIRYLKSWGRKRNGLQNTLWNIRCYYGI